MVVSRLSWALSPCVAVTATLVIGGVVAGREPEQRSAYRAPPTEWGEPNLRGVYTPAAHVDRPICVGAPSDVEEPTLDHAVMRILQSPGFVVLRYSSVTPYSHVIPVARRAHVSGSWQGHLGSPSGYWDADTLVIEWAHVETQTWNVVGARAFRIASVGAIERLTLVDDDTLQDDVLVRRRDAGVPHSTRRVMLRRLDPATRAEGAPLPGCPAPSTQTSQPHGQ